MNDIVRMTVPPDVKLVGVVNAALAAFCALSGLERGDAAKLQLALEEVFSYCVKTIRKHPLRPSITLRFQQEPPGVRLILEHEGPRGELDVYFRPGRRQRFERTSFEALGLFMAGEILDSLECEHDARDRVNRFFMSYAPKPGTQAGGRS